jgi:hypothetical protein
MPYEQHELPGQVKLSCFPSKRQILQEMRILRLIRRTIASHTRKIATKCCIECSKTIQRVFMVLLAVFNSIVYDKNMRSEYHIVANDFVGKKFIRGEMNLLITVTSQTEGVGVIP